MILDVLIVVVIIAFIALDTTRGFLQGLIDAAVSVALMFFIVRSNGNWRLPYCNMLPLGKFMGMFLGILVVGIVGGFIIYRATLIQPAGPAEHVFGGIFGLVTGLMVMRFFLLWGAYYQLPKYDKCMREQVQNQNAKIDAAKKACEKNAPWYQSWIDKSALFPEVIDLETLTSLWGSTKGLRDPESVTRLLKTVKSEEDKYKEIKHSDCIERVAVAGKEKPKDNKDNKEKPKYSCPNLPVGKR